MPRRQSAAMLLASGAAALLLAACTTGSSGSSPHNTPDGQQTTQNTPTGALSTDGLPTAPATGDDTGGDSGGPGSSEPSGSGAPQTDAVKTVAVHITIGAWNTQANEAQVDAFVPGRVIRGGTCTLTMTQGDTSRTAERAAITTPTATSCGLIAIPRSELSAGTWSAVVRFEAPTASGKSEAKDIEIPA